MAIKSKEWKWEIVSKKDKLWTTPAKEVYFLCENWKEKGFKEFLDVGCGMGRNAIYLAKCGFEISAFDLSEESVNRTKENFIEEKLNLKQICVADMLEFPYENESFDCLLAMNVISHTDTNGFIQILKEINRVLKPGGEAYFTLGSKKTYWYQRTDLPVVDENTKIRIEDGPENGIPHFYVDDDCGKFFGDFDILDIFEKRDLKTYNGVSCHYHVWLKKK